MPPASAADSPVCEIMSRFVVSASPTVTQERLAHSALLARQDLRARGDVTGLLHASDQLRVLATDLGASPGADCLLFLRPERPVGNRFAAQ